MIKIVVCRQASDPIPPGFKPGYKCVECGKDLVATPSGQEQIAAGGLPICNACGFALADKALAEDRLGPVSATPEAKAALERLARKAKP